MNAELPIAWTAAVELIMHALARRALGWLCNPDGSRSVWAGIRKIDVELRPGTGRPLDQGRQLARVHR